MGIQTLSTTTPWHRNAGWLGLATRKAERRDEMASWSEDTRLCRGLEIGCHLERMARPQCQGPADAWIGRGDLDLEHNTEVVRNVELVAAEMARLENAIEAGVAELLVQFFGIVSPLLR